LLGEIEPAGRLVTTFPAADGAAPAWEVVPTDGDLRYDEGTAIGYRGHFAGQAPAPAFWLGHGLGYATWDYSGASILPGSGLPASGQPAPGLPGSGGPVVEVTVTNTGERDSREVVQVYYRPDVAGQPVRLVGWTAVEVAAGKPATVQVTTDARLWRRWDPATNGWGSPLTGGGLLIARGLGDIRAELSL
jgi:beta-glucosidase